VSRASSAVATTVSERPFRSPAVRRTVSNAFRTAFGSNGDGDHEIHRVNRSDGVPGKNEYVGPREKLRSRRRTRNAQRPRRDRRARVFRPETANDETTHRRPRRGRLSKTAAATGPRPSREGRVGPCGTRRRGRRTARRGHVRETDLNPYGPGADRRVFYFYLTCSGRGRLLRTAR